MNRLKTTLPKNIHTDKFWATFPFTFGTLHEGKGLENKHVELLN